MGLHKLQLVEGEARGAGREGPLSPMEERALARRWRAFEDELARREATEWLATLGIRPVPRPKEPGR